MVVKSSVRLAALSSRRSPSLALFRPRPRRRPGCLSPHLASLSGGCTPHRPSMQLPSRHPTYAIIALQQLGSADLSLERILIPEHQSQPRHDLALSVLACPLLAPLREARYTVSGQGPSSPALVGPSSDESALTENAYEYLAEAGPRSPRGISVLPHQNRRPAKLPGVRSWRASCSSGCERIGGNWTVVRDSQNLAPPRAIPAMTGGWPWPFSSSSLF